MLFGSISAEKAGRAETIGERQQTLKLLFKIFLLINRETLTNLHLLIFLIIFRFLYKPILDHVKVLLEKQTVPRSLL